jgi:flagellar protein FlgJ
MKPALFVKTFLPDAKLVEKESGISAVATLTQAALESAWGEKAPGNMFFGVKDTDGINGNEQVLITTEYSRSAHASFPRMVGVPVPVIIKGQKYFKYTIHDYFRKYKTPADCFRDHSQFFIKNKRYAKALLVSHDYNKFFDEIAKAGYATDPSYAATLKAVSKSITKFMV